MSARSNLSVLTQSHKVIASKKRAKQEQIKEIVFDDDARRCVCYFFPSLFALGAKDVDIDVFLAENF
jgi:hypothetical protein